MKGAPPPGRGATRPGSAPRPAIEAVAEIKELRPSAEGEIREAPPRPATNRLVNLSRDPTARLAPGSDPIRDRATVGAAAPIDPDDDPWAYDPGAAPPARAGDGEDGDGESTDETDEVDDAEPVLRDDADAAAGDAPVDDASVAGDADVEDPEDDAAAAAAAAVADDEAHDEAGPEEDHDDDAAQRRLAAAAIAAADEAEDLGDPDAESRRMAAAAIAAADDGELGGDTMRVGPGVALPTPPRHLDDDVEDVRPASPGESSHSKMRSEDARSFGDDTLRAGPEAGLPRVPAGIVDDDDDDDDPAADTVRVSPSGGGRAPAKRDDAQRDDENDALEAGNTVRVDPRGSSFSQTLVVGQDAEEPAPEEIGDTVRVNPEPVEEAERETVRVTAEPRGGSGRLPPGPDPRSEREPEVALSLEPVQPLAEDLQLKSSSSSGERKRTMRVSGERPPSGRIAGGPGASPGPRPALLSKPAHGPSNAVLAAAGAAVLVLLLLIGRGLFGGGGITWAGTAADARAEARSSGRPLVVVVMDPKLPDCKLFAEKVLASPEVKSLGRDFVWLEERVEVKVVEGGGTLELQLPEGLIAAPPLLQVYGPDGVTPIVGPTEARGLTVDALCAMLRSARSGP